MHALQMYKILLCMHNIFVKNSQIYKVYKFRYYKHLF